MANISLWYADFCCIRGHNFWLKKAMGCLSWDKTAPTPVPDASVSTVNGFEKSGN
ncbi:hypothetical protein HanXRQr2_Chr08g0337421 [Helianthus annuus]|uniref:Uncharacterized protein n=1 Tax=Helianthus annuus TaxID=4232 RepID=A0A9K3IE53_HELAN|nr:hypothetical protein HanXRQr2_Chr08g0337421 [Helianthus annuus]